MAMKSSYTTPWDTIPSSEFRETNSLLIPGATPPLRHYDRNHQASSERSCRSIKRTIPRKSFSF